LSTRRNALAIDLVHARLGELAEELKLLERRRQDGGLPLGEARLWRDLHAEILSRLTAIPHGGERREALRVPCKVELTSDRGTWLAHDFGPGGLGIEGEALPPVGSELALQGIAIDGSKRSFAMQARVAWSKPGTAGLEIKRDQAQASVIESLYSLLLEAYLRDA
jgi:hypothetical protein